jgi:uncharacterized damage-inducible protein DinB
MKDFFTRVLSGVSGDLTRRTIRDKWSAHENLAHLARYHEIFLERIGRILNEDKPAFSRYRAEKDPDWAKWQKRPYLDLMDTTAELRERLVSKLRSLSDHDFRRIGVHPTFGEMELSQWLEFFLVHEGHHLYLIFQQVKMLQRLGSDD